MLDTHPSIVPPAPAVHPKDLPSIRRLFGIVSDSLSIWPEHAFDTTFSRSKLFGLESALINDPAGIRYILATNAVFEPTQTKWVSRAVWSWWQTPRCR